MVDYILVELMTDEKKDDRGFDSYIPVWDGRSETLREFKKAVQWWLHSIDLEKTTSYNLAARFAMRQKGSAKLRALEFDPKELEYIPAEKVKDEETDEMVELTPAVYDAGIQKILASWDDMVGRSQTDRKGELREKYYLQLRRGGSESIPNFALRYRTLVGEMKAEGIMVDPSEQAWFFKQKLALTELQRQMLETTLGVETEDYGACEREAVRLFKRVHFGHGHGPGHGGPQHGGHGNFAKRPTSLTSSTLSRFRKSFPSTTSSSSSTWRRGGGKGFGGSVNVTEYEDEDPPEYEAFEAEEHPAEGEDDGGGDSESLGGFEGLQQTLEAMATELDELADGSQADDDLAAIEEQVEGAVEALVTLREARSQINALKRDRGFRGPGTSSFKGGKGRGKKGSTGAKDGKCFACGQTGHWQGDPECPAGGKSSAKGKQLPKFPKPMHKTGASSSTASPKSSTYRNEANAAEVNVVDLLEGANNNVSFDLEPTVHEINVVSTLSEALTASAAGPPELSLDKMYVAALDSACNRSCAGEEWIKTMKAALNYAPPEIKNLIMEKPVRDYFRFGNGGILESQKRIRLPIVVKNQVVLLWLAAIPCGSLGCLLGKDFLESLGATLNFSSKKLQLKYLTEEWTPLSKMKAGHFSLNLLPKPLTSWPTLGPLAWHVVGVGGCCEVQCEGRVAWKAHNRLVDRSTDVDGDLNMVVHYIPEFFSSSSSWQLEDDAQSLRDLPDRFAMATSSAADGCQEDLALEGSDAVVGATSIPALPARALAGGHECGGVEDPAQGHGATQGVAEAMVAEGPGGDESFAPSRGSDAPQPHGLGGGVHGRRGRDVRDQGTEETSPCSEASCTSSGYAPSNRRAGWPEGRTRQRASRTPRRDASQQGRPGQAGGSPERDRGPQGHQRPVEGQVQADGGRSDGESPWLEPREIQGIRRRQRPQRTNDWLESDGSISANRTNCTSPNFESSPSTLGTPNEPGWAGPLRPLQPPDPFSSGRLGTHSSVLPAERDRRSDAVKLSVGTLGKAAFKDLKSGARLAVRDGVMKARRMRDKMGAPVSYLNEIMEAEYVDFIDKVASGQEAEVFMADLHMPPLPASRFDCIRLPISGLREQLQRPSRLHRRLTDEWRFGHINGWICRDHYCPRRILFHPSTATVPRFFPNEAFTGLRRSVFCDEEGNINFVRNDNFKDSWNTQSHVHSQVAVQGETWLEVKQEWIEHAYPPWSWEQFSFPIRTAVMLGQQGSHDCQNGDKFFVGFDTMNQKGMLPVDSTVPISSWIRAAEDGWMMLEEKVLHRDRAVHRVPHGSLIKSVEVYVQLHHNTLREDPHRYPMVGELYTETEPVSACAIRKGHAIMQSIALKTGYDLMKVSDRRRANMDIRNNRPFCLMIAFPCSVWSNLINMTTRGDPVKIARLAKRRKYEKILVEYAAMKAVEQVLSGNHFILENPATSAAWRLVGKLRKLVENAKDLDLYHVRVDQCAFGLRGAGGGLHYKPTTFLTSSKEVAAALDGFRCDRRHHHEAVIGGNKVTRLAGHYPPLLAETLLEGIEREWSMLEINVIEELDDENTGGGDDGGEDDGGPPGPSDEPDGHDGDDHDGNGDHFMLDNPAEQEDEDDVVVSGDDKPTAGDRKMAKHLHEVTGHRPPLRLARALLITGADPMLIKAAKEHKCEICHETKRPGTRRPASLPRVRNFNDHLYADLISVHDSHGETYWIAHAVDAASRYQVAKVLEEKSGLEVIKFFQECWFNTLGIPSQITTDLGREFTAAVVQHTMDMHDVVLHHVPVGAPWQNGIAERAGGSLKAVLRATIHEAVAAGMDDMRTALASALEAVNNDVDGTGFSPSQMVLGRQPRLVGEAGPSDLRTRLAAHSMALETPSFSRLVAMREVAKLAMVRLHYSRALMSASVARARNQVDWNQFSVGDVVYFYREQKPTSKKMKIVQRRRLELKKWHGPGVLLSLEGKEMPNAGYVAYCGNVTKVAMEHLRHASALERLVATDWDAIVEDVINAVDDKRPDDQQEGLGIGEESYEPTEPPEEPPEVQPELLEQTPTPAVVYPFPYPAMMPALVQSAPCSSFSSLPSRLASRRQSTEQAGGPLPTVGEDASPEPDGQRPGLLGGDPTSDQGAAGDDLPPLLPQQAADDGLHHAQVLPVADGGAAAAELQLGVPAGETPAEYGRRLEQAQGAVRRALSEPTDDRQAVRRRIMEPLRLGGKAIDVLSAERRHPLLEAVNKAQEDIENGHHGEDDHGSWDGRWSRPAARQVEIVKKLQMTWPSGSNSDTKEALTTAAHGRELKWSEMDEDTRQAFRVAAADQWNKWLENEAVTVLNPEESRAVEQELEMKGELERIMNPRFILVDKNSKLRSPECPLPLKANARIIVPG